MSQIRVEKSFGKFTRRGKRENRAREKQKEYLKGKRLASLKN